MRRCVRIASALLAGVLISGCAAPRVSEEQIARVAKDWCMTIRGSQVMPVYPLTEDVLSGDVFLVTTTIQSEQKEFKQRGFLPLPLLVTRLHPSGIEDFYLSSHGTQGRTNPPYFWRFDGTNLETNRLCQMPRAAFPSYQFSTRGGGGLNIAVPIEAIPVAINLAGGKRVEGSVLLSDAYTYGFDQANLQNLLLDWAGRNSDLLEVLSPADGGTNYLRMISRIYLVGGVSVQVNSVGSFAGSASGGADKPVNLPNLDGTNTVEHYTSALASLSSALSTALNAPGGTLKVSSASSRSASLNETFPRPLVVGYLGFDLPVLPGGQIGFPQDTMMRVKGGATHPLPTKPLRYSADSNSTALRAWLREDPANVKKANEWLAKNYSAPNLANVITAGELRDVRKQMVEQLVQPPAKP
jgi:hypothetical protein